MTRPLWGLLAALGVGTLGLGVLAYRSVREGTAGPSAESFAYRKPVADAGLPELWPAPSFTFTDHLGRPTTLASFSGRPFIADFIYTTCTSACPLITARMVSVQRRLGQPGIRFVSFSVDPQHDTEAALAAYREKWNPAEMRWILLRTDEQGLGAVSSGMRVAREKSNDPENPIVHTSVFFLVDGRGSVRGVYDSSDGQALDRLIADASSLVGSPSPRPHAVEASGEELYATFRCAACHDDPKVAPALGGVAGRSVASEDGGTITADAAYVRESIVAPGAKLVNGYLNLMPSYADELSKPELDRLVTFVLSKHASARNDGSAAAPAAGASADVQAGTAARTPAGGNAPARPSASAAPMPLPPSVATDPVCGMSVRVAADTPSAVHAGKHFYFCSDSCRERFEKDPEKFLSKPAAP